MYVARFAEGICSVYQTRYVALHKTHNRVLISSTRTVSDVMLPKIPPCLYVISLYNL